jgi:hypothetical protein
MPRPRRFYIYRNTGHTPVADMDRRPNPSYEIEQWQMEAIEPTLADVYSEAAAGIRQYARHLDARMGSLWPTLDTGEIELVAGFLADVGGNLLQTPGAAAFMDALNDAVDGSVGALGPLAQPVRDRSREWKRATARAVGNYLREIRNRSEPMVVVALRDSGALPAGAEDLPDDDIDVTSAVGFWLGEALIEAGPGVMLEI